MCLFAPIVHFFFFFSLALFLPGNYGERGYQSTVAPGTSKNCLTVGATANVRIKPGVVGPFFCAAPIQVRRRRRGIDEPKSSPGYESVGQSSSLASSEAEDEEVTLDQERFLDESIQVRRLYSFISGAGLTYDGRFKPDILAPGHYIVSARSSGSPDKDRCTNCEASLMSLFGTSMSAAIAAGSAALVRQYFGQTNDMTRAKRNKKGIIGTVLLIHFFIYSSTPFSRRLLSDRRSDSFESFHSVSRSSERRADRERRARHRRRRSRGGPTRRIERLQSPTASDRSDAEVRLRTHTVGSCLAPARERGCRTVDDGSACTRDR